MIKNIQGFLQCFDLNFFPIVEILSASAIALIVWYGGTLISYGENVTIGELTAFILLVAIIAAIAINMSDRERALRQDPAKQILETKESRLKIIKDNEI